MFTPIRRFMNKLTLAEIMREHIDQSCPHQTSNYNKRKGSVTLLACGGKPPYVYSKDNFATEQSSPVFENLLLADADAYESQTYGFLEGIQRFWVKDSKNNIAVYDAILKRPAAMK